MPEGTIDTRLVYGFLDAGKTTYIQDCIENDYFYKYGATLILCFEQGETDYDREMLSGRRTTVAYYEGETDIRSFCLASIEACQPDRIYVEMNTMTPELRAQFPPCMQVGYAVTWIDWETLPLYFANFKQLTNQMVSDSGQIIFRGCPSKALLEPYSRAFRVMNRKAVYLRQDPMGYHEKAFDLFLPFSLEDPEIAIDETGYVPFWLDALDHPEHYEGKILRFLGPLELRRSGGEGAWRAGRVIMVCCMADLQFMSFPLEEAPEDLGGGWVSLEARGLVETGEYGRRRLGLQVLQARPASPPGRLILDVSASGEG